MRLLTATLLMTFWFTVIGCGPAADTGLPPLEASPGEGADPDANIPPEEGGAIAPPRIPPQSFATTKGGYITFTKIDSYSVMDTPELKGASEASDGVYLLFERTVSYSIKMWDVYRVIGGSAPTLLCSIPRPGMSGDRFYGFAFSGSAFKIFSEVSSYPSGTRIYNFTISGCTVDANRNLPSSSSYNWPNIFVVSGAHHYYSDGSQIKTWDERNGLVSNWAYSTSPFAGVTPNPLYSTFAVASTGTVWFMDYGRRLWRGTQGGTWDGFAEIPYGTYSDLSYAKYILAGAGSMKIITFNRYRGSLMIYHLNTLNF